MIGIVYCSDLNRAPFINKYLDVLNRLGYDYRIITWDRTGYKNVYPDNYIVYDRTSDLYDIKIKKIIPFLNFSRFLNSVIRKYDFSKLIILTTFSALMMLPLLSTKYKGRYIFDFRDLSYERYLPFRNLVKYISRNSFFTCVSSPKFRDFIEGDVLLCHNFNYRDIENEKCDRKDVDGKIHLLHIGISRGDAYNKKLIEIFGGDERFEVTIAGSGNDTENVLYFAKNYSNIHIYGKYDNSQKSQFIDNCDALLYYYPCSFNNNRALANKYYDGLIYKKPLIGNINTYSGQRIVKRGVGVSMDFDAHEVADDLYKYMKNIDSHAYLINTKKELNAILKEDKKYMDSIEKFVLSEFSILR